MSFHFKDGALDASGVIPAMYTTMNPLEQAIIEKHPDFKNGTIKVLRKEVFGEEMSVVTVTAPEDEVTTLQKAKEFLISKGATIEQLQTKAMVLETAKEMGITFKNWK